MQVDVPIVGMIFFIIHVIYTVLHLRIYDHMGEMLRGQVSYLCINRKFVQRLKASFLSSKLRFQYSNRRFAFRMLVLDNQRTIATGIYHRRTSFH